MTQLLGFALIGLGAGAVYAALGLGTVIIYRATGVINFAAGALGAWSTYVYSQLRTNGALVLPVGVIHLGTRVRTPVCLIVAATVATLLGLLVYALVFRPLRAAPTLAKVVASAGVMIAVQPLIAIRFGTNERIVDPILPASSVSVGGTAVPIQCLVLAGIVIVAAGVIGYWLRATRVGIAMRAAAENEFFVSLAQYSPDRLAALAWAVSSCGIGVISVLAAPLIGLDPANYTLLVVPALAGALIGRLKSLGWTVFGGLALGVVNGVITDLTGKAWWPAWAGTGAGYAVPLIAIVLLLIVLGRRLPTRDLLKSSRLPAVPRGRIKPLHLLALIVVAVGILLLTSGSYRFGLTTSMIYAVMSLSFVVLTGLLGQVSFAQAVLAGTAGFVLSKLSMNAHIGFPWAPLLASFAATGLGLLTGIPALRIRGVQLTVVTLAAAVAIEQAVFSNNALVGAFAQVPAPRLFGLNLGPDAGYNTARLQFALLCLVVLIICALAVSNLIRSATGRRFLAVRSNERAAAAVGIDVAQAKLVGFALSSFLAGLSGCLIGYSQGSVSVASFTTLVGVSLLMFAYLGGITSVGGALVAGTFAPLGIVFALADRIVGASSNGYELFAALAVIVTTIINPEGIAGKMGQDLRSLRRRLRARFGTAEQTASPTATACVPDPAPECSERAGSANRRPVVTPAAGEPALAIADLTVRFGGVCAADNVTLEAPAGKIVGLIGANGAGKTTVIDAVSGFLPYGGSVKLNGLSVEGLAPHRRARLGLSRTWQSIELFDDITVRDNVQLAAEGASVRGTLVDLVHPTRGSADVDVDAVLETLGIADVAGLSPDELSLGQRKRVNIARALVSRPHAALLDEPAAGLSRADTHRLGVALRDLADSGIGVLLVDHDVGWVLELCDVIYVLDFGRIIAHGPPAVIRESPAVIAAYLGSAGQAELADGGIAAEHPR
jgi:ABC-type branched-subunit amino acid transport system ATPase component/branched-subunit amino acid ABC-type transport system permease component